jgi:hypothetical protein
VDLREPVGPDLLLAGSKDDWAAAVVLVNDGLGHLLPEYFHPFGNDPVTAISFASSADFDGDGRQDLIVGDTEMVAFLHCLDNGTFGPPVRFNVAGTPSGPAIAYLDDDRLPDVATANWEAGNISVVLNRSRPPRRVDCDADGRIDSCEIADGTEKDRNENGIPDRCEGGQQRPGDANQDAVLDLSDAIWILRHLFLGGPDVEILPCEGGTAASPGPGDLALVDVNGDGRVDVSDPVSILQFLFLGTEPPGLGTECVPIGGCPNKCS